MGDLDPSNYQIRPTAGTSGNYLTGKFHKLEKRSKRSPATTGMS